MAPHSSILAYEVVVSHDGVIWMHVIMERRLSPAGDIGDSGSIPELGGSPGGGNGTPLQYSCLENPMDGGAW